jgi:hypothetical protein
MLFTIITLSSVLSLVTAAPTILTERWPSVTNILKSDVISIYYVSTGAITYNVPTGIVAKTPNGEITTLVTFENTSLDLPSTCRLRFYLDNANTVLDGTKQVNVFSSRQPAPKGGSTGWGPGNQRDQDIGRFLLYKGGNGDLVQGTESFPCPKKGAGPVGFEVVPVGDVDRVEWSAALSGLYLTW